MSISLPSNSKSDPKHLMLGLNKAEGWFMDLVTAQGKADEGRDYIQAPCLISDPKVLLKNVLNPTGTGTLKEKE